MISGMALPGAVIVRDREATDPDSCWVLHSDCADRVIATVRETAGYERLYAYGPAASGTCCATDCPH